MVEGVACFIDMRTAQAPGWQRPFLKLQALEGGCACMQAFSLSLESMASRSLLHDMGVQQPKILQFTAWKGPSNHRAAAAALQALWQSPGFVDSRAKFGLLAANTNIESDDDWESLSVELPESRRVCCLLCCLALTLMQPEIRECIAGCMSWDVSSVFSVLICHWSTALQSRCAAGPSVAVTATPAAVGLASPQAQGGCLTAGQVSVEDIVRAETIEGQSRASTGESKGAQAGSTIDCIVHLRPLQQALGGGQLSSSAPDWLSGVGRPVRIWLQHWLKPRHLKGENS